MPFSPYFDITSTSDEKLKEDIEALLNWAKGYDQKANEHREDAAILQRELDRRMLAALDSKG